MNVCKVPDMCKDMEYKYITEDSKTRVYLSVVREFNEAEYEKYYIHKKKEKVRKRILFIARALKYALPVLASTILYNMLSNKLYLERGKFILHLISRKPAGSMERYSDEILGTGNFGGE